MKSIRSRLMVCLLAGFLALLGLGGAAVYLVTRAGLRAESDAALLAQARAMAALVRQDEGRIEYDFPPELLAEFSSPQNAQHFEIRDSDGKLLRSFGSKRAGKQRDRPVPRAAPMFWDSELSEQPARSVGMLFSPQQDENDEDGKKASFPPLPVLSLVLTRDESALRHTLGLLFTVLAGVGGLTLAGALLLVAATVRSGLRPIDDIGDQAARIDASSLDYRFAVDAVPVELRSICKRLNDLLSRLGKSFSREQRFSSDVAHELRTPVAELRSLAEVALKFPPCEAETPRAFQDALDIARKMDGIATGLLSLVRCEEGRQVFRDESLALRPIIEKAWAPFSSRAALKTLKVVFGVPDGFAARGDRAAVEIILTNILSNAVEYSPAGGGIEITAWREGARIVLACANPVEDLHPEDLAHLSERFWRKDPSRQDSTHSGLGLAISQKFAQLMETELRLEMLSESRFQISFTLAADADAGARLAAEPTAELRYASPLDG